LADVSLNAYDPQVQSDDFELALPSLTWNTLARYSRSWITQPNRLIRSFGRFVDALSLSNTMDSPSIPR